MSREEGRRRGGESLRRRWATDPVFALDARLWLSAGGERTMRRRRACLECGLVTTPPALAVHQSRRGHTGWAELETPGDAP